MTDTTTAEKIIAQIASIARNVGWGAGEPAMEIAGGIVSWLSARPDQIDRFMTEGGDMFVNGEINATDGDLTWLSTDGRMMDREKYQTAIRLATAGDDRATQQGEV